MSLVLCQDRYAGLTIMWTTGERKSVVSHSKGAKVKNVANAGPAWRRQGLGTHIAQSVEPRVTDLVFTFDASLLSQPSEV